MANMMVGDLVRIGAGGTSQFRVVEIEGTHARILATRAREAGVPVRHVTYPGMGHVGVLAALSSPVT